MYKFWRPDSGAIGGILAGAFILFFTAFIYFLFGSHYALYVFIVLFFTAILNAIYSIFLEN